MPSFISRTTIIDKRLLDKYIRSRYTAGTTGSNSNCNNNNINDNNNSITSSLPSIQLLRKRPRPRNRINTNNNTNYLTGTRNGNYFRVPIDTSNNTPVSKNAIHIQQNETNTNTNDTTAATIVGKFLHLPKKIQPLQTIVSRSPPMLESIKSSATSTSSSKTVQCPGDASSSSTDTTTDTTSAVEGNVANLSSTSSVTCADKEASIIRSFLPNGKHEVLNVSTTEKLHHEEHSHQQKEQRDERSSSNSSCGENESHKDSHSSRQQQQQQQQKEHYIKKILEWIQENYTTLILNFGSICSLIAFTRSDILDLRSLSVVGSACAVYYNSTLRPFRKTPVLWSLTFTIVNSYKIYEILEERKGTVQLTNDQQERYVHYFLPHGVTPKQFSIIDTKAEKLIIPKGNVIIRQNEPINHVYLIVKGTTRASTLGRYLTAVSLPGLVQNSTGTSTSNTNNNSSESNSNPIKSALLNGSSGSMSSGAWIGEMKFLQHIWDTEKKRVDTNKGTKETTRDNNKEIIIDENACNTQRQQQEQKNATSSSIPNNDLHSNQSSASSSSNSSIEDRSLYTIVAQDDCYVLRWTFNDMEQLLCKSPDMKAALTRAMTAAVVGKVIRFTMSKQKQYQQDEELTMQNNKSTATIWNTIIDNYFPQKSISLSTTTIIPASSIVEQQPMLTSNIVKTVSSSSSSAAATLSNNMLPLSTNATATADNNSNRNRNSNISDDQWTPTDTAVVGVVVASSELPNYPIFQESDDSITTYNDKDQDKNKKESSAKVGK